MLKRYPEITSDNGRTKKEVCMAMQDMRMLAVDNEEEYEVGKRNVGASLIELNQRTSELLGYQM